MIKVTTFVYVYLFVSREISRCQCMGVLCSTGCICTAENINYARPAADTDSLVELYDSCIRRNVGHA